MYDKDYEGVLQMKTLDLVEERSLFLLSVNVLDFEPFYPSYSVDADFDCHIRVSNCPAQALPYKAGDSTTRINFLSVQQELSPSAVEVFVIDMKNGDVLGKSWFFATMMKEKTFKKRFKLENDDGPFCGAGTITLDVACVLEDDNNIL